MVWEEQGDVIRDAAFRVRSYIHAALPLIFQKESRTFEKESRTKMKRPQAWLAIFQKLQRDSATKNSRSAVCSVLIELTVDFCSDAVAEAVDCSADRADHGNAQTNDGGCQHNPVNGHSARFICSEVLDVCEKVHVTLHFERFYSASAVSQPFDVARLAETHIAVETCPDCGEKSSFLVLFTFILTNPLSASKKDGDSLGLLCWHSCVPACSTATQRGLAVR